MKNMKIMLSALLVIGFILVSCNSSGSQNGVGNNIPKPSEGKATLAGILARKNPSGGNDIPYGDVRIYVGVLIKDVTGTATIARISEFESPQTRSDLQGKFIFNDLDPGKYILAVQAPPNELLKLNDPTSGEEMVIELNPGDVVDLGVLYYELIPFITPSP